MSEIKKSIGYGAEIIVALLLGHWYSKERDRLLYRGEPWIKSWTTLPGIIILVIIAVLIAMKWYSGR